MNATDQTAEILAEGLREYPRIVELIAAEQAAYVRYLELRDGDQLFSKAFITHEKAAQDLERARRAARDAFCKPLGLRIFDPPARTKTFSLEQLRTGRAQRLPEDCYGISSRCLDGPGGLPEFFLDATGRPTAIVSHTTASHSECEEFARESGLRVEYLTGSWMAPGRRMAALFVAKGYKPPVQQTASEQPAVTS